MVIAVIFLASCTDKAKEIGAEVDNQADIFVLCRRFGVPGVCPRPGICQGWGMVWERQTFQWSSPSTTEEREAAARPPMTAPPPRLSRRARGGGPSPRATAGGAARTAQSEPPSRRAASASAPENMPSMRLRISSIRAASSASISSVLSSALLALSTDDCLRTHAGATKGWTCRSSVQARTKCR